MRKWMKIFTDIFGDSMEPQEPEQEGQDCQTGRADVCRAGKYDGITCPDDSCDIDDEVRKDPKEQEGQKRFYFQQWASSGEYVSGGIWDSVGMGIICSGSKVHLDFICKALNAKGIDSAENCCLETCPTPIVCVPNKECHARKYPAKGITISREDAKVCAEYLGANSRDATGEKAYRNLMATLDKKSNSEL